MKKTLLAAALLAGFATAGVAQAETSVTLYGIIDAGVGYTHVTGDNDLRANKWGFRDGVQSGSRFGLRGVEDLGDGLHARFNLEGGFSESTGRSAQDGRLFGRRATVGLASDNWGSIDFGRQTNVASNFMGAFDPFGASFLEANAGTTFTSANTYRVDNMIQYNTPDLSGFKFGIGYSGNANGAINAGTNEDGTQASNNNQEFTTGLRYTNGPIDVTATYDLLRAGENAVGNTSGDRVNISEWILGGSYDFEVIKAYLAFGQNRNGLFQRGYQDLGMTNLPTVNDGFRSNSSLVGLSAPLGGGSLMFSWQHANASRSSDEARARIAGNGGANDSVQNIFGAAYTYPLSKRTNLYAYGAYTRNVAFQEGVKGTDVAVGLRHRF